jgi:hypothetical protein
MMDENDNLNGDGGELRTFMRQVLIFERPPGRGAVPLPLSFPLFFPRSSPPPSPSSFSLFLFLLPCLYYPGKQLCMPTGRFIRFGTCHGSATAAAAAAVAVVAPVTDRRLLRRCSSLPLAEPRARRLR